MKTVVSAYKGQSLAVNLEYHCFSWLLACCSCLLLICEWSLSHTPAYSVAEKEWLVLILFNPSLIRAFAFRFLSLSSLSLCFRRFNLNSLNTSFWSLIASNQLYSTLITEIDSAWRRCLDPMSWLWDQWGFLEQAVISSSVQGAERCCLKSLGFWKHGVNLQERWFKHGEIQLLWEYMIILILCSFFALFGFACNSFDLTFGE